MLAIGTLVTGGLIHSPSGLFLPLHCELLQGTDHSSLDSVTSLETS